VDERSLTQAADLLEKLIRYRLGRNAQPIENGGVPILLEVACLCGTLKGEFVEPDRLTFLLGGQERRDYVGSRGLLLGQFRSMLGSLAFLVDEILHADVPRYPVEGRLSHMRPDEIIPRTGSVDEQARQIAEDIAAIDRATAKRDAEIAARGLPSANPYGFQLVMPYVCPDGEAVSLHVETSNTLAKPFYLLIQRVM
jgi:hypothetical protein